MEDILGALKNFGLVGVAIALLVKIAKTRPITLLTAHPVELKLIDKDTRYYIKIIKAVGEIIGLSLGMLVLSFGYSQLSSFIGYMHNNNHNLYFLIIYFLVVSVSLYWSILYLEIKKKTPKFINKYRRTSIALYFLYVFFLLFFPPFGVGMSLGAELKVVYENLNNAQAYTVLLILFVLFGVVSSGVLFLWKQVSKVFDIDRSKEQSLYIKIDDEEWFLQNHMREDYIYLTDNPSLDMSRRIRFVKWEEILKHIVYIDNIKSNNPEKDDKEYEQNKPSNAQDTQ
jgi:hypothetical protein